MQVSSLLTVTHPGKTIILTTKLYSTYAQINIKSNNLALGGIATNWGFLILCSLIVF